MLLLCIDEFILMPGLVAIRIGGSDSRPGNKT